MLFLHRLLPQIHLQNLFLLPPTPVLAAPAQTELRLHKLPPSSRTLTWIWEGRRYWRLQGGSDLGGAVGVVVCTGVLAGSLLAVLDGGARLVRVLPLPLVPAQRAAASRLELALPGPQEHRQGQIRELLTSYTLKRCLVTGAECCTPVDCAAPQLSSKKAL